MSKKNIKKKKFCIYHKYSFDRNLANLWNYECYKTWCLMDEGQEKPDPQRLTNFLFKYGLNHPKIKRSVLSYIPKDYKNLMERWIRMTKSERKKAQSYSNENIGKKITHWLHEAEILYWNDINNFKK